MSQINADLRTQNALFCVNPLHTISRRTPHSLGAWRFYKMR
ncbi:hypothetical protein CFter6_1691 [Collimonas fungivorans]|uniref:Uncharacterized protein n=1 Tax=Collimonas fungivorans TaxID=158899 RepID=A0A127P9I1_9BURK|nr:hypothetical protein CFter6_1691 [Collimonas fungivorans]